MESEPKIVPVTHNYRFLTRASGYSASLRAVEGVLSSAGRLQPERWRRGSPLHGCTEEMQERTVADGARRRYIHI
jgi:hypothetical protein